MIRRKRLPSSRRLNALRACVCQWQDSPIDLSSLPARAANSDQRPPRREGGNGAPGKKPHRGQSAGKPREPRGEKVWSNDAVAPAQKRPFRRNKKGFGAKAA